MNTVDIPILYFNQVLNMNSSVFNIDEKFVKSLLSVVDKGLVLGKGDPIPGEMCVEAAVCYAMGLPHGDEPSCVNSVVRNFKINLNDLRWSSDIARAKGMRRLAVAQLGSDKIDGIAFSNKLVLLMAQKFVPIILKKIGLTSYAEKCKEVKDLRSAYEVASEACEVANHEFRVKVDGNTRTEKYLVSRYALSYIGVVYDNTVAMARALSAVTAAASLYNNSAIGFAIGANSYVISSVNSITNIYKETGTENPDFYLCLVAQLAEEALVELKSPGCEWLHLCNN